MDDAPELETQCNPDCVYVPASGWWCQQCGVFSEVDDKDVCAECRARCTDVVAHAKSPRGRRRR